MKGMCAKCKFTAQSVSGFDDLAGYLARYPVSSIILSIIAPIKIKKRKDAIITLSIFQSTNFSTSLIAKINQYEK